MSDLDAIREDVAMAARSAEMARHVALDHTPELLAEVERLRATIERIRDVRHSAVAEGHASPYLAHMIDQALDGASDPRRVETAEKLATFPNRTVFIDSDACAGIVSVRPNEYHPDKPSIGVRFADSSEYHDESIVLDVKYPVRVLWLPEVSS